MGATTTADRPSMEQVLGDYVAFRDEAITALDDRFGPKDWAVDENASGWGGAGCPDDVDDAEDAETARPPTLSFDGTWDRSDWDAVRETVREIGEEHGFPDVRTATDREDGFEIVGQDAHGGRYVFGTAVNTIFSLSTGCHRWDGEPTYPPPPA